jgi:type VI secretion system protein ImpJ
MKQLRKLVWSEGMYLGPHHFQTQNRYFEDVLQFGTGALWFEPYGFAGYQFDADALRNGTVGLIHARGIFPDGLAFHMPESDALPPARNITEEFPPTRESVTVLLAVPPHREEAVNCVASENGSSPDARYVAERQEIPDDNTGSDEKPVLLGRKNIRLLLDTEPSEGLVSLPVARVIRGGSGQFVYDPAFVPPCVQIAASPALMSLLERMIDIMSEKSAAVSRAGARGGKFGTGLSEQELANFWFLHAVNSGVASLRHLYLSKRGHPEELYLEMCRVAGALCTFAIESHPRDLPLYQHTDLEKCFKALDEHIRGHLEMFVPRTAITIRLSPTAKYFYGGDVLDQRCLDRARWVFGIHSEIGEVDLIARATNLVKICSARLVPELVKRALPGLTLVHLPVPPSGIAPRVEFQYFSVNRAGPCWEHIVKERRVGVYVPGELPEPEVELFVILDQ